VALLPNEKLHCSLGYVSVSIRFPFPISLHLSSHHFLSHFSPIFPIATVWLCFGELLLHFYLIALLTAFSGLLLLSHGEER